MKEYSAYDARKGKDGMKKFVYRCLLILLLVTFAGCAGKEEQKTAKSEKEEMEGGMKVYDNSDSMGLNPFLPLYEYIPDGEPRVFGDRVYLYGSHDMAGGSGFCLNDYVVYSASVENLTDWQLEGTSYRKEQDPRYVEGEKMALYAPDVIEGKDGKYYLYYCLEPNPEIGVAVSDSPAGPFEYLGLVQHKDGTPLGKGAEDWLQFDPSVFIDDDGTIYLYSGNSARFENMVKEKTGPQVMTLEEDMLTLKTEPKQLLCTVADSAGTEFEGHEFFEASSMRKINGIYYMVYSSVNMHELCYAYSKYPDKDFVYGGVLISNSNIFTEEDIPLSKPGTNHGGMACIKDQWYIFYHRNTNNKSYSRQACAEPIYFSEDGRIQQVEATTTGFASESAKVTDWISAGRACEFFGDFATLDDYDNDEAPFVTQTGEDREGDAHLYVTNMSDMDKVAFKYFNVDGLGSITVSVRGDFTGMVEILDQQEGKPKGTITIKPSKDWTEVSADVSDMKGDSPIYFRAKGSGILEFEKFKMNFEE